MYGLNDCKIRQKIMAKRMFEGGTLCYKDETMAFTRSGVKVACNRNKTIAQKLELLALNFKETCEPCYDYNRLDLWRTKEKERIKFYADKGT